MTKCSVKGCDVDVLARGLCSKHYTRQRLTGTTDYGSKPRLPLEERFWRYVDKRGVKQCWEWTGLKKPNGYGQIGAGGAGGATLTAHRLSYEIATGKKIPPKMVIMHSCDNPGCVNPNHLRLGTFKENTQDMLLKGRKGRCKALGNANYNAVLTPDLVRYIRSSDAPHTELANEIGVSPNTVRGVRIGRTWSHVK